ncbi:MAG: DinB family protein [candidate division Zixibacteria bacterium]|nr:DinB family protein [candidate division Zixibacteria bacterium]
MFTSIAEFEKDWTRESGNTQKYLDALTDSSLSQAVNNDHRTLARMAWHIAVTLPEMMKHTGLTVTSLDEKAPVPKKAAEIQKAYKTVAKELLDQVKENWKDEDLAIEDNLYGEQWKRGATLEVLLRHEIHHRGQMSVLMRQAGVAVPGVYGPSKEEWTGYGAPVPEV